MSRKWGDPPYLRFVFNFFKYYPKSPYSNTHPALHRANHYVLCSEGGAMVGQDRGNYFILIHKSCAESFVDNKQVATYEVPYDLNLVKYELCQKFMVHMWPVKHWRIEGISK